LLYDRDLTGSLGLSASLNAHYQSKSYSYLENGKDTQIDGYGVMNATLGIHTLDQKWDLTLWGNNLTDEYYWLSVTQNANTIVRFPGKTRTYGASLTYRF